MTTSLSPQAGERRHTFRLRRRGVALAMVAIAAAACGSGATTSGSSSSPSATGSGSSQLNAQVASFDLATGQDQRLLIGLFGPDRGLIGGGQIQVRLGYLGTADQKVSEVAVSDPVPATFLPVPGTDPTVGDGPGAIQNGGAGVYQARVDLDRAGFWGAQVAADVDGTTMTATASFQVNDTHQVPTVGDPAPRTDNPTADSDVDAVTIDSRAQGDDPTIPDPSLHQLSIPDVLDAGRPMVVVISTPVYCQSRFCGPITDYVEGLSEQYADRADFVHLEVWKNFDDLVLNSYVTDWVADPETGGGNEPWTFLVGADGTITARWDNVLDADALEAMLQQLPAG